MQSTCFNFGKLIFLWREESRERYWQVFLLEGANATLGTWVNPEANSFSPSRADRSVECPPSTAQLVFHSQHSLWLTQRLIPHVRLVYIYIPLKVMSCYLKGLITKYNPMKIFLKIFHVYCVKPPTEHKKNHCDLHGIGRERIKWSPKPKCRIILHNRTTLFPLLR